MYVYSEMATIQKRKSHGQTYWYIVESRRINGKPRPVMLAYLGKAEDLLELLTSKKRELDLCSYSHGHVAALLNVAMELDIVGIFNKYIPAGKRGRKPLRDGLTVGASFLLGAIGRACCPTSKDGWYQWCKSTSLEYCLKRSFKALDSQHFWDQMNVLPVESIPLIEEELVKGLIEKYGVELDTLLFDTTNFFTFIDSTNGRCAIAQRGKNKQKRCDLRQVGMALLVTRKDELPIFHKTYRGNTHDCIVWREEFENLTKRLKSVTNELCDITLVFDKGNNSKHNFSLIDQTDGLHYVASLVPSCFPKLLEEANKNLAPIKLPSKEEIPVYSTTWEVWGKRRTCVVLLSQQLLEGQVRGIQQALVKKCRKLQEFKEQLESPRRRRSLSTQEIEKRIQSIIEGQYVKDILKYEIVTKNKVPSFNYFIDKLAFEHTQENQLGRQLLVTNRSNWSTEEIISAYRAQSKVEYAFRTVKNPYHLAVRPQYHWTDQKIEAHFFMCLIAYMLVTAAYSKAKKTAAYNRGIDNFMDDLASIRLAAVFQKSQKKKRGKAQISYQLEKVPECLAPLLDALGVNDTKRYSDATFSVYK